MKKLIVFTSIFGMFISNFFSQDIIFTKSQTEIKAKVLEITAEIIKYKEYDFVNGPTRNIAKSNVFMIQFANGKKEFISVKENKDGNQEVNKNEKKLETNEFPINRISFSPGLGMSYCLGGIRTQYRRAGKFDFGVDFSLGMIKDFFNNDANSGSQLGLGLKWYFFNDLYLNANYSTLGKSIPSKHNSLASFLLGMDIMKYSKNIGYGLNIGLGFCRIGNIERTGYDYSVDPYIPTYSNELVYINALAVDFGIVVAFGVSD